MEASRLPPETPRRQLLKRIHRRSSILPSMDPSSHLAPSSSASSSTSTARSSSRRTSLNPDNSSPLLANTALEKHDEAEEDYSNTDYDHSESQPDQAQPSSYNQASNERQDATRFAQDADEFQGDENGEEAAWAQVDELMDTLQLRNQRILELEKTVSQLQRDLQAEKERTKSSKGKSGPGNADDKGLTRAAAVKLEREFLSQEMILKGLQRDNEDKTLEVEALRRKVKVMSDFLARQYGPDDWEAVVSAASGAVSTSAVKESLLTASPEKESLSAVARVLGAANTGSPRAANRAKFTPVLGCDANANPFSPTASSPSKALGAINNDDVLIPTIARMQTPSSSPSKLFVSSFAAPRNGLGDADTSVDQVAAALAQDQDQELTGMGMQRAAELKANTRSALPDGVDPNVLLASIESVRLLIQGFERKNAMRRAELESTIDNAIQAERRAERLQSSVSAASTMTPSLDAVSVAAS